MVSFQSFSGIIMQIDNFYTTSKETGCMLIMSLLDGVQTPVNFIVSPNTYFVDHERVEEEDLVIGFYDANAPTPMIYPPQLQAIVMASVKRNQQVKVDFFNSQLVSSDQSLKLNISSLTPIILENDQLFTENPADRYLIVVYGATTRSIPAQTTPHQIIVLCNPSS